MHAYALESLASYLSPGARCLDVGSGSGYLTACMAHMVTSLCDIDVDIKVGDGGLAVGVEHVPELVVQSQAAIRKYYPSLQNRLVIKRAHNVID